MAAAVALRGPKRHLLAGNLPEFSRDRLGFLTACAREHGDVVPLRFGVFRALFINDPSAIEQVLGNSRAFVKSFAYQIIRPVVADGLLLSEGDFWLRQRRLVQPVFQRARLVDAYTPVIVERTQQLLGEWAPGEVRDVHADMMRLTAQVAGQAFFGADVSDATGDVSHQLLVLGELLSDRLDSMLSFLPDAMPTPTNLKVRRAVKRLDGLIYRIIEERRKSPQLRDDLLSRLLAGQDEDGGKMTDRQLRDEVMTFFLAGHDPSRPRRGALRSSTALPAGVGDGKEGTRRR
jgi:cytochrome P450